MKYLSDLLSLLRILSIAPVLILSFNDEWMAATCVLLLGWSTDLLDGLVARRFGSLRDRWPHFDADGIADSVLAFGASAVPVVYYYVRGDYLIAVILTLVYILTALVGGKMASVMNSSPTRSTRNIIRFNMIVLHGIVQIAGTLGWFAYMAAGVEGLCLMFVLMLLVALHQGPKIELWMKGALR